MNYEVVDKIFVNEQGNKVNYKRLVIQGYLNGYLESIELPISKEQALIYKAMSTEAPSVTASRGGDVDVTKKSQSSNEADWLSD